MTMTTTSGAPAPVRTATAADEDRAYATLAMAFVTDPVSRWAWPDPHTYLAYFARFAKAFGGGAFEHGSAYLVGDFAGAALWLPPGVHPDEETMGTLIVETASAATQTELFAVVEQMGSYHPTEPHWYLPMIGIDPVQQGRGLGSALLRHALEVCDRDGTPAYLESSNPRNVPLYQRHGFEAIGAIQVGRSPTIVPMFRKPR
jgi:ribosomal protein S18 acetylase RimI-like enzyme